MKHFKNRSPRKFPGFVSLQKITQKASCDLHDVKNMIIGTDRFHPKATSFSCSRPFGSLSRRVHVYFLNFLGAVMTS